MQTITICVETIYLNRGAEYRQEYRVNGQVLAIIESENTNRKVTADALGIDNLVFSNEPRSDYNSQAVQYVRNAIQRRYIGINVEYYEYHTECRINVNEIDLYKEVADFLRNNISYSLNCINNAEGVRGIIAISWKEGNDLANTFEWLKEVGAHKQAITEFRRAPFDNGLCKLVWTQEQEPEVFATIERAFFDYCTELYKEVEKLPNTKKSTLKRYYSGNKH